MRVERSINDAFRVAQDWESRWGDLERSLVSAWERGREKNVEDPELADRARLGQLVVLPWKGGVEKAIQRIDKVGTHLYVAMWQGLRGDDLDIDTSVESSITCSATGVSVVFSSEFSRYANQ